MKRDSETLNFYRKRLPHWEVAEGLYFVTIRQAGSIPKAGIDRLRKLSIELGKSESFSYVDKHRKIFLMLENLLDNNINGNLTETVYFGIIKDAIEARSNTGRWRIIEYVIMSNHIHLFFENKSRSLAGVIKEFKRWTTAQFNKKAKNNTVKWQREWFDHWSRSADEDEKIMKYIRNNPVKAGLVNDYTDWAYGSWSK